MHLGLCLLLMLGVSICTAQLTHAQQVEGQFTVTPTTSPDGMPMVHVVLALRASAATLDVGHATLMLAVDPEVLRFKSDPVANEILGENEQFRFHAPFRKELAGPATYETSVSMYGGKNRVAVNLVLTAPTLGVTLSKAYTPVVDLYFEAKQSFHEDALRWVGGDRPDGTVVFRDDNRATLKLGALTSTTVVETRDEPDAQVPLAFTLAPNYPNPFNPSTTIRYALPSTSEVVIEVFDVLGRRVDRLVDDVMPSGWHEIEWNAQGWASGMYILRAQHQGTVRTQTLMFIK